ncbi:MAG: alpha-L-fucosidase [bacterium]
MKNRFIRFVATVPCLGALLLGASIAVAGTEGSSPTMEQVYENRKMPTWFNEAKFGIFVTWGPYSVPASTTRKDKTGSTAARSVWPANRAFSRTAPAGTRPWNATWTTI